MSGDLEDYVMSDWGAVNDRVKGLKAGLELEMPGSGGHTDQEIVDAVKNGELDEAVLDRAVERILNIVFKFTDNRQEGKFDKEEDHKLAAKIEAESMVLLKNEGILPLPAQGKRSRLSENLRKRQIPGRRKLPHQFL